MVTAEPVIDARKEREKHFHDDRFGGGDEVRKAALKYYSIMDATHEHYHNAVLKHAKGARLLEYGCGAGSNSVMWAKGGAKVTGIDISTSAIEIANADPQAQALGIEFREMDAEYLQFEDNSFDLVVGTCILHHLDLHRTYRELGRVLKPGGRAIFIEPLGHNPLINFYRWMTPKMRTVDEHPLLVKDIKLGEEYFGKVDARYFHIATLAAVPFRKLPGFKVLLSALGGLDRGMMAVLPFTRRYSWMSVIEYTQPDKSKCCTPSKT